MLVMIKGHEYSLKGGGGHRCLSMLAEVANGCHGEGRHDNTAHEGNDVSRYVTHGRYSSVPITAVPSRKENHQLEAPTQGYSTHYIGYSQGQDTRFKIRGSHS
jgi:hypothetical protein